MKRYSGFLVVVFVFVNIILLYQYCDKSKRLQTCIDSANFYDSIAVTKINRYIERERICYESENIFIPKAKYMTKI